MRKEVSRTVQDKICVISVFPNMFRFVLVCFQHVQICDQCFNMFRFVISVLLACSGL